MTPRDPSQPTRASLRYAVFIQAVDENGEPDEGDELLLFATGLTLPRVGEVIHFAADADNRLTVTVTEVEHWFYAGDDDPPHRDATLTAQAGPKQHKMIQNLREPGALEQWIKQFPWLDEGDRLPWEGSA